MKAGNKGGLQYHRLKDECGILLEGKMVIRFDNGNGEIDSIDLLRQKSNSLLLMTLENKFDHNKTRPIASASNQREMTVAPSAINDLTLLMWAELPIVSDNGRTSRKKEFLYSRPFTPGHVRFITSLNRSCQATRTQRLAGLRHSDAKTLRRP